ncbi:hypothetical protein DQ04_04191010 [Trypanosoma grayi]|uniref:hypothetical protein n=1 Tax=Trypanosoma grayi TaxID=71804 RepID=UPI0004F4A309|nr:hypothetical protein DQ04_04191010 [Trypanosoma grayi]KEG10090.1 hypothetical protein DQ04_04191010 [Trypanosoma grayi]
MDAGRAEHSAGSPLNGGTRFFSEPGDNHRRGLARDTAIQRALPILSTQRRVTFPVTQGESSGGCAATSLWRGFARRLTPDMPVATDNLSCGERESGELHASAPSPPVYTFPKEAPEPSEPKLSFKQSVVDYWKRNKETARLVTPGLSGNLSQKPTSSHAEASSHGHSLRPCDEASIGEWSAASVATDEEMKDSQQLDTDACRSEKWTYSILCSVLQRLPEASLRSRYFHAWWRRILQHNYQESGGAQHPVRKETDGRTARPIGASSSPSPAYPALRLQARPVPGSEASVPSEAKRRLTPSEEPNAARPTIADTAQFSGTASAVSYPLGDDGEMSFGDADTRSQRSPASVAHLSPDVFSDYSSRRQSAHWPPTLRALGAVGGSGRGTQPSRSSLSQGMALFFSCGKLEEEEAASRALISHQEMSLRHGIQTNANRVMDKILMLALRGRPSGELFAPGREESAESAKRSLTMLSGKSSCTPERQDWPPPPPSSTPCATQTVLTSSPPVVGYEEGEPPTLAKNGPPSRVDDTPGTSVAGSTAATALSEEATVPAPPPSSSSSVVGHRESAAVNGRLDALGGTSSVNSSSNNIKAVSGDGGDVVVGEMNENANRNKNGSVTNDEVDSLDEAKNKNIPKRAAALDREYTQSAPLSSLSPASSIRRDAGSSSSSRHNNNGASSGTAGQKMLSSQKMVDARWCLEFREEEHARRLRIAERYRRGLEHIIHICFVGSTGATATPLGATAPQESSSSVKDS